MGVLTGVVVTGAVFGDGVYLAADPCVATSFKHGRLRWC